ncbi:MAG: hypothetical protein GY737_00215 [Desulfobacteraceae bacterium]|nr:hypothetical protein [Desulfobacteraceae bacterium]
MTFKEHLKEQEVQLGIRNMEWRKGVEWWLHRRGVPIQPTFIPGVPERLEDFLDHLWDEVFPQEKEKNEVAEWVEDE